MEALISYPHNNPNTGSNIFNSNNNTNSLEKQTTHHLINSFQIPLASTAKPYTSSLVPSSNSPLNSALAPTSPLAKHSSLLSPQMHASLFNQYASSSLSATSIAAAAQLAAEMHQKQYNNYQQNHFDFLKMFSSPTSNSPQALTNPTINVTNNTSSNISNSPHSADKLLNLTSPTNGSTSQQGTLNGILTNQSAFLPTNEDSSFYNAVSASFVGRLASKISKIS